jgi:hypothetical protein
MTCLVFVCLFRVPWFPEFLTPLNSPLYQHLYSFCISDLPVHQYVYSLYWPFRSITTTTLNLSLSMSWSASCLFFRFLLLLSFSPYIIYNPCPLLSPLPYNIPHINIGIYIIPIKLYDRDMMNKKKNEGD